MAEHEQQAVSEVSEAGRPRTTDRDIGELAGGLRGWLETKLPEGSSPEVSDVAAPATNGMSSETLMFEASWIRDGRRSGRQLVARVAPRESAVPVFPDYDLGRQFNVMRLVESATTVPVPRLFWFEADGAFIGSPFFVMERVEGLIPPDVMPYTFGSWLSESPAEGLSRLQDATVAVLAELHGIEAAPRRFSFLESSSPGATHLRRHVEDQRAYYEWAASDGNRSPLLERCFGWLEDNWPSEGPPVFSWGDSRIGNVIYRDFEPVAVLDWEMAALVPREVDLGWLIYLHWFFQDLAEQVGLPGMPDFLRMDDVASCYESLTGHEPRDLGFYTVYAALRHGIVMSRVQRRAIHFGEAEMPDDPDDLILHRPTLESMVEGTYWR